MINKVDNVSQQAGFLHLLVLAELQQDRTFTCSVREAIKECQETLKFMLTQFNHTENWNGSSHQTQNKSTTFCEIINVTR